MLTVVAGKQKLDRTRAAQRRWPGALVVDADDAFHGTDICNAFEVSRALEAVRLRADHVVLIATFRKGGGTHRGSTMLDASVDEMYQCSRGRLRLTARRV